MIENKAFLSLEEDFRPIVREILLDLESQGWKPQVIEGRRTLEQQKEKVRRGVSKTMKSYHLSGNAADICDVRYMWNISNVHPFWWALYQAAKKVPIENGRLRCGIIWDHPEREAIYKKALDEKKPALVNWFADVAHVEIHWD